MLRAAFKASKSVKITSFTPAISSRCIPLSAINQSRSFVTTETPMNAALGDDPTEVLQHKSGSVGFAVLNRPKALNALTTGMVEGLYDLYKTWDNDPSVSCIILKGTGEKAFCAGGDVKTVVTLGQENKTHDAVRFFRSEYQLNRLISRLRKPHIALIDGITMGGGVGVSIHGTFRVATERTLFAMPECAIGFIPDVGGSYVLPRLPGGLGLYLGLTGARLKGVDVLRAHIATHYIASKYLAELEDDIQKLGTQAADETKLKQLLDEYQRRERLPESQLAAQQQVVDAVFADAVSVEMVYSECEKKGGDWGSETIELMKKGSPTSQKLTFELYHRGKAMNLADVLRMEFRLAYNIVHDTSSDFYTGVTAALITKQGNPQWKPNSLEQVNDVERFLQPLPAGETGPDFDVGGSSVTAKL